MLLSREPGPRPLALDPHRHAHQPRRWPQLGPQRRWWRRIPDHATGGGWNTPRLLHLGGGRLLMICDWGPPYEQEYTPNSKICSWHSEDGGVTWSEKAETGITRPHLPVPVPHPFRQDLARRRRLGRHHLERRPVGIRGRRAPRGRGRPSSPPPASCGSTRPPSCSSRTAPWCATSARTRSGCGATRQSRTTTAPPGRVRSPPTCCPASGVPRPACCAAAR